MKFLIDYTNITEKKILIYNIEEYSFDTEPYVETINFDVVINRLNLTAVDADNKIIQLWGFCGYKEWIRSNYNVPPSRVGILKVADDLEGGLAYRVSKENFPIYVNVQSGWICIGDPEKKGNTVEFITNCVAVIDGDGNFISLWLKPQSLPHI